MRVSSVILSAIGYELAPHVITTDAIEQRLAPAYAALRIQPGQLYALTGIRERRWWGDGVSMADGAARAARKAIARCGVDPPELGMVIYAGVCRDNLEPETQRGHSTFFIDTVASRARHRLPSPCIPWSPYDTSAHRPAGHTRTDMDQRPNP